MIVKLWADCGLRETIYERGIEAGMTEEEAEAFCWNFKSELELIVRVDSATGDYKLLSLGDRKLL